MRYLLTIAGLLAAVTALPAHAAPTDGNDIAQCVVDNDLGDVKTLLDTLPGSNEEHRVGARVLAYYGGCNDNKIMGGQIAWRERAEIANAALLNRLGARPYDVAAAPPRARWALATNGLGSYNGNLVSIRQYGDCVAALAPADALRLVRSDAGSRGEAAAIAALQPALNDCLAPGKRLTFKRADLRFVLAEPLYHMTTR